jgi:phenylpropionate dioxygenase-like ring-hydroxylating dioxygenase large terminal subunit
MTIVENETASATPVDTGTAYGLAEGEHDAALTEVGAGTPMGELMRRYWQPVGPSAYATDLPKAVRILGEDLILFRDREGNPGLVHPRCTHRGASLLYARVDDCGLRCCYHGWAFDTQGMCTDQPCEPQNGLNRDKFRQPWYPVEERYGLIWAYLGPPEKKPLLQRYNLLEELGEGEQLFVDDQNIGCGRFFEGLVPFNWLQHFENIHDAGHFLWLHYFHSGPQFGSRYGEFDKLDFQPWERLTGNDWYVTERGVSGGRTMTIPDGRTVQTIVETVLPYVRVVPNPFGGDGPTDSLGFVLPVDDTNFRIFTVLRAKDTSFFDRIGSLRGRENQVTDPAHFQRFPGDWEAQGSQGPITLHSEEHLATSDKGVRMLRRLFREQLEIVANGGDPMNVAFESGKETINMNGGQFFLEPTSTPDGVTA